MNVVTIGSIYVILVGLAVMASLLTIQEKLNFVRESEVLVLTD